MNTNFKKLAGAAAIAAGTAAALFGATGTAQATIVTSPYANNGFGTTVQVSDTKNPVGSIEVCTYSSHVAGHPFALPYFTTVRLSGPDATTLQIFGISTGTTYQVNITCPDTGTTKIFQQTF
jgi:4-hydroxy-3-methylbut-2-en-1-yl diphosphate synthase IspG/GcpE